MDVNVVGFVTNLNAPIPAGWRRDEQAYYAGADLRWTLPALLPHLWQLAGATIQALIAPRAIRFA